MYFENNSVNNFWTTEYFGMKFYMALGASSIDGHLHTRGVNSAIGWLQMDDSLQKMLMYVWYHF